jgi:hypothetical protein
MPIRELPGAARRDVRHRSIEPSRARLLALAMLYLIVGSAGPAAANPWNMVGSRFQAMGGAGLGTVDDSTAFYYNPAAFGFKKRGEWDVQLPITANASIENELLRDTSDLAVRANDLKDVIDQLESGSPADLTDTGRIDGAIQWLNDINALGARPQSVHSEIGFGLLGHTGSIGFGALSNTTATIYPDIDVTSFGFDPTGLADLLSNVPATAQQTQLKQDIANIGGFWDATNAGQLVDAFVNAPGVDPNDPKTQDLIFKIANGANQGSTFANNESGVLTTGLSIQEFGISYGYALPSPVLKRWLDKKVSVGATAKYLLGIAYVQSARYVDSVSGSGLGDIGSFKDSTISSNFGLDLGIDYRPLPFARIGIVARNVNAPKFNTGDFGKIRVHPEVRMGMSLMPIERFILAFDVDLTENRNPTLENAPIGDPFRSRLVSLGTEYTIPIGKPAALALRFGAYTNTASGMEGNWALTGGLGLKLWSFVLDLSAGGGLDRERIRTDTNRYVNVPDRMNLGLGFKWVKSI